MTNSQAIGISFIIIAVMLFASHEWLAAVLVFTLVAAPALLLARHTRA